MTLPLPGRLRPTPRGHREALRCIRFLYGQPKAIERSRRTLSRVRFLAALSYLYLHALPYLLVIGWLGRRLLSKSAHLQAWSSSMDSGWATGLWLDAQPLVAGLAIGLAAGLVIGAIASAGMGFSSGSTVGLASSLALGLVFSLTHGFAADASQSVAFSTLFGFGCGTISAIAFGLPDGSGAARSSRLEAGVAPALISGAIACLTTVLALILSRDLPSSATGGIATAAAYLVGFLRLYYVPLHIGWIWPHPRGSLYRFHPVAWDDLCLLPLPLFDRLLVAYVEHHPATGNREIDRLLDEHPSQRPAALRASAILTVRRAGQLEDLVHLDDVLATLPGSNRGFFKETSDLLRRAQDIAASQRRLDTFDRAFLREPYAALLVKEIENFVQHVAGFQPPLSTELRLAARNWLEIARRELESARTAAGREPMHQVFSAGEKIDRERVAFVRRNAILGDLEQLVMLATGCPALLIYGRRKMGKSTLLHNLQGLLPRNILLVRISMQNAEAFTSLSTLVSLMAREISRAVPGLSLQAGDLQGLARCLNTTQDRLSGGDERLLIAIDEYENLDRKIGAGVLDEDLLAVLRDSIQTHRRIVWAFVGSHGIEELRSAPWTSYLVSARTLEVGPFDLAETRLLLTEPLKHSTLWASVDAEPPRFEPGFWGGGGIERIHTETGGWPILVQLVAQTAIDLVNDSGSAALEAALLERAFDKVVQGSNNFFIELVERESRLAGEWKYLSAFRTTDELPPPGDSAVERSLRRRRLVLTENGRCHLRVPLVARWLRKGP